MDPKGLRVTQNAYYLLLTHAKELLLVTFCDPIAKTGVSFWTHRLTERTEQTNGRNRRNRRTDGQTDVKVNIVI